MEQLWIPLFGTLLLAFTNSAQGDCPPDWIVFNKNCFRTISNTTYTEAIEACDEYGATLANRSDPSVERMLFVLADANQKPFWISSNDVDGICETVENMNFSMANCSESLNVICQKPLTNQTKYCVRGDMFQSSCIYILPGMTDRMSATLACLLMSPSLMYKASFARVIAVTNNISLWVGRTKQEHDECLMVSPTGGSEAVYQWSPGGCDNVTAWPLCEYPPIPVLSTTTTTTTSTTAAAATVTSSPAATTTSNGVPRCPVGYSWKSLGDKCYWETSHETDRMSWDGARRFCQRYGGDLASYSSVIEETVALSTAKGIARGMWMGLRRQPEENEFHWSDGSPLSYTHWGSDQPKLSTRREFCVTHVGDDSHWETNYCGTRRWFICEVPKAINPVNPGEPPEREREKCTDGMDLWHGSSYLYGDNCYYIRTWQTYTWKTGKTYCEDHGAHLVSVHSYNETDFILDMMDSHSIDSYWIGLQAFGLNAPFTWEDGTPLDFANWEETVRLRNITSTYKCVAFDSLSGFWSVDHCNRLLPIICKRPFNRTSVQATAAPEPNLPGFCPDDWYTSGNKCYKPFGIMPSEKQSWHNAKKKCLSMHANLVTIHSQDEQDFLVTLVLNVGYATWIGLYSSVRGSLFHWVDETMLDYTNWNDGEPFQFGREEDCVEMVYGDVNIGRWNDIDCNKAKGYICEKSKDSSLTTPGCNPSICSEPKGWAKLSKSCYIVFEEPETWLDAQKYCRQYNASLTSVHDYGTSVFLRNLISGQRKFYWLGIREIEKDTYRSFSGYPLSYTNWMIGQPQRVSQRSNCVAVDARGQWLVQNCNEKRPFFCQFTAGYLESLPNAEEGMCPNNSANWINIKGPSCFWIETEETYSWNSAMHSCFINGGSLASFHSREQLNSIFPYLKRSFYPLHIGFGRKQDGSFGWVDGSPVDFTSWQVGEPNSDDERCTEMHTDVLTWNDIPCSERRGYICSVPKVVFKVAKSKANYTMKEKVEHSMAVGGIVGIVMCILVILVTAGVISYYTCPSTRNRSRRLSDSDTPLHNILVPTI